MGLIGLLIVLILAVAIIWAAATYLPAPINWVVVAIVIVVLLVMLLNIAHVGTLH